MALSKITAKGRVTIPAAVRERLRLRSGDRIDFRVESDGSVRLVPVTRRVDEVFGVLARKSSKAYSPEEEDSRLGESMRRTRTSGSAPTSPTS